MMRTRNARLICSSKRYRRLHLGALRPQAGKYMLLGKQLSVGSPNHFPTKQRAAPLHPVSAAPRRSPRHQ
jgi:hypothetical protein